MSILVTPTVAAAPADVTTATTIDTSAFKIGANVLYTAIVYQRHTTPASLGTVTSVVGDLSGAWTPWPTNPTRTYGGASPTGRQTAYWFLSSADIAETKVRATLSAAQVGARLRVFAIGGTRVASPIVQCVAADSAGASVLTLATPPSFLGFADVRNGAIASLMVGAASALTPKINWTEVAETSAVTIDTDFQWIGVNDGTANVTASVAGPMSAIAAEIAAPPGAVTYSLAGGGAITTGAVGTGSGPFVYPSQSLAVRAGRISVLHWTGGNPAGPPTGTPVWSHSFSAGVTATQVYYHYDPNAGGENLATAIYHLTSTVDGANFQTIISGTTSSSLKETWQLHELGNVDVAVNVLGPGLVSMAHTESASPTAAFALSSLGFASRENFALLLSSQSTNSGTLGTTEAGWALNNGLAAGGNCAVQSMYRPNSPQSVTGTYSAHTTHVVVLEFAGLPVTHPPVATLVSPSPPTIAQAASVTIDVTDDDGDLAGVTITANGEPVYTTAGGFVSPYTGSSTSGVTNGTRFVVTRTGGWLAGSLAINVLATDARAQSRAYSFLWSSVTVPTFHDPVWTVDSPPTPGSIGDTVPIVIEVNDVDNDIDFSTISIQIGEAHAFLGSAFQDPYDNTSTVVATAHGWKFTILQDGGVWTGDDVGAYCTASDTHGEGHALFIWTPVVHPVASAPTITLVSPPPGAINQADDIVIDFKDVDGDLDPDSILPLFRLGPAAPELAWEPAGFTPPYVLSAIADVTNGKRYTFRRVGRWPIGSLRFDGEATDDGARTTTATFTWTVVEATSEALAPIDVLGPGGLLFQSDERAAAVWHFDEPDGVQPSDVDSNVLDLAGVGTLPLPVRAAGIVGHGRKWASPHGMGAKDAVVDATTLTRTMALEVLVYAQGDGTRVLVQRGLNDGTDPERVLYALKYIVAGSTGTLQMAWQRASGAAATVPGQTFDIPPGAPWLYLAAVRRWVSATVVVIDYYVNGVPIGSQLSAHGDIDAGSGGTVLIGVLDGAGTPASGMLTGDIIDEIRISNAERTAEEIRQVFRRLFVNTDWARSMLRSFLPPGKAYSRDPSSVIQREVGAEADGLAHAWHLASSLLDDFFPDRATQTLERWEGLMRFHPHPDDFYADRRARVVGRLSSIAGFSRAKIAEAIAPVLGVDPSDIVITENSNRYAEPFSGALDPRWFQDAGPGNITVGSGTLTLAFQTGDDAREDASNQKGVRIRRGLAATPETEAYVLVTARNLTNTGDIAGIRLWEFPSLDRIVFGVGWNGSAYRWMGAVVVGGVNVPLGVIAGVPPAPPFYLRVRHNGDGTVSAYYSTTGWEGPWTTIAEGLAAPVNPQWAGVELLGGLASAGSDSSVAFDEFRLWMPQSLDVFRWFVTSSPPPAPSVNLRAAQSIVDSMTPAHTQGLVFGSLFLCDDPDSLTDNDLLGS